VRLKWDKRDVSVGGNRFYFQDPTRKGRSLYGAAMLRKAKELGLDSKHPELFRLLSSNSKRPPPQGGDTKQTKRRRTTSSSDSIPHHVTAARRKSCARRASSGDVSGDVVSSVSSSATPQGSKKHKKHLQPQDNPSSRGSSGSSKKTKKQPIIKGDRVYVRCWGPDYQYLVEEEPKKGRAYVMLKAVLAGDEGLRDAQAPLSSLTKCN